MWLWWKHYLLQWSRGSRAGLFITPVTPVDLSEADSIIQHQLSLRNPCKASLLLTHRHAGCKHEHTHKKKNCRCKFLRLIKVHSPFPLVSHTHICCFFMGTQKGPVHWSSSLSIVCVPAELNITYQCCLKLTPVHQGLQSVWKSTVMCQEIHRKISSKPPGSSFMHK